MSNNVVFAKDLDSEFHLDGTAKKIKLKIDGLTLVKEANGTIKVDVSALAIGPSADAGNLLVAGSDGRLMLEAEAVQDAIGQAIANGVGIEYDDAMNALKVAMGNMQVGDTETIDLNLDMTTDPSQPGLSAEVKLNAALTNNLLKITAGQGLGVAPDDVLAVVKANVDPTFSIDDSDPAAPMLDLTVHGDKKASQALEQIKDAFGTAQLGFVVKA